MALWNQNEGFQEDDLTTEMREIIGIWFGKPKLPLEAEEMDSEQWWGPNVSSGINRNGYFSWL